MGIIDNINYKLLSEMRNVVGMERMGFDAFNNSLTDEEVFTFPMNTSRVSSKINEPRVKNGIDPIDYIIGKCALFLPKVVAAPNEYAAVYNGIKGLLDRVYGRDVAAVGSITSMEWMATPVSIKGTSLYDGMRMYMICGVKINERGNITPVELSELASYIAITTQETADKEGWFEKFKALIREVQNNASITYQNFYNAPKGFEGYWIFTSDHRKNTVALVSRDFGEGFYILNRTITLDYNIDKTPMGSRMQVNQEKVLTLPWKDALKRFIENPIVVSESDMLNKDIMSRPTLLFRRYLYTEPYAGKNGIYLHRANENKLRAIEGYLTGNNETFMAGAGEVRQEILEHLKKNR